MKVAQEKFSMRFSGQNLNVDIFFFPQTSYFGYSNRSVIIVHPGNFLSIFVFFEGEWLAAIIKREIYIINSLALINDDKKKDFVLKVGLSLNS